MPPRISAKSSVTSGVAASVKPATSAKPANLPNPPNPPKPATSATSAKPPGTVTATLGHTGTGSATTATSAARPAHHGEREARPPTHRSAEPANGLLTLLEVEREARDAASLDELAAVIANQTPKLTRARQAFVLRHAGSGRMVVTAVTGLPAVDRSVPLVQEITRLSRRLGAKATQQARAGTPVTEVERIDLAELTDPGASVADSYPFRHLAWLPLTTRGGDLVGAMLLAHDEPLGDADLVVARRLAAAYGHAWTALLAEPRVRLPGLGSRRLLLGASAAAVVALFIPVPMTSLAPLEIVPASPFVVSAPIAAAIEDVVVAPNAAVKPGDLLVRFVATDLDNALAVAARSVEVAEARLKRSSQAAFSDPRMKHELAIASAELDLKRAERDYARDLRARAEIRAASAGVAVYADRKALIGKPMTVGERIMEIADPARVEVLIEVPVADAMLARPGAAATLYLDSDPLAPLSATLTHADYRAQVRPGDRLAFLAVASLPEDAVRKPRLGVRGTAQLFGERVALGYYLFRRPIAALRQWSGL